MLLQPYKIAIFVLNTENSIFYIIKYQLHIHNTKIVQSEHIKYWIHCSDWSCYQVLVQKIVLKICMTVSGLV